MRNLFVVRVYMESSKLSVVFGLLIRGPVPISLFFTCICSIESFNILIIFVARSTTIEIELFFKVCICCTLCYFFLFFNRSVRFCSQYMFIFFQLISIRIFLRLFYCFRIFCLLICFT